MNRTSPRVTTPLFSPATPVTEVIHNLFVISKLQPSATPPPSQGLTQKETRWIRTSIVVLKIRPSSRKLPTRICGNRRLNAGCGWLTRCSAMCRPPIPVLLGESNSRRSPGFFHPGLRFSPNIFAPDHRVVGCCPVTGVTRSGLAITQLLQPHPRAAATLVIGQS